jgi:3-hydroxyisobutyrate dehydrogenase-like beta-hydroxyacid dehydrogenase
MNIGFVGVGSMGRAIIPLLIQAGHRVSAWNRTADALAGLNDIDVLASATLAFEQPVVISLLADDAAVKAVLLDSAALKTACDGCIHIVMSTLWRACCSSLRQFSVFLLSPPRVN